MPTPFIVNKLKELIVPRLQWLKKYDAYDYFLFSIFLIVVLIFAFGSQIKTASDTVKIDNRGIHIEVHTR